MTEKPFILAVCGPTASGKSALALQLAKALDGEIVSCDSMQIYRGMDIGTAKPTEAERTLVPHHMIDVVSPDTNYSCAEYAKQAKAAVLDVLSRGKLPILCGGTGLYLDSVLSPERFAPDIPAAVEEEVKDMPIEEAYARLCACDPLSAEQIHPHNEKRVRRALAVFLGTGVTKSEWDERSKSLPSPFDAMVICLDYADRNILYDRINMRVDVMLREGLLAEAKRLNLDRDSTAGQAIGYKELYRHLDGELTLEEAIDLLKKNTRNYAKRQLTWFRRREGTLFLAPDALGEGLFATAMEAILAKIEIRREQSEWT